MTWRDEVMAKLTDQWSQYSDDPDETAEERGRRMAAEEWYRRDEQWRRIAPARFADACVDDLDGEAAETFAEWRAAPGRNLLIFGTVGTGKTHMAYAVLRHLAMVGFPVGATSMVDMLHALRPAGGGDLATFVRPAFLLVDDLGTEKPTEWVAEQVNAIVDGRWRDQHPTLVTSNMTPQQLKGQLGERAWSRLQDGAVAVSLTGQDRRR